MCGIFGYIGEKDTVSTVFNGLKRLEYRGYDSAGIAVSLHGKILVEKEVGKLENLVGYLKNLPETSEIGLGHTRWATHGIPSKSNAHPHLSEKVVIVHNAVIQKPASAERKEHQAKVHEVPELFDDTGIGFARHPVPIHAESHLNADKEDKEDDDIRPNHGDELIEESPLSLTRRGPGRRSGS